MCFQCSKNVAESTWGTQRNNPIYQGANREGFLEGLSSGIGPEEQEVVKRSVSKSKSLRRKTKSFVLLKIILLPTTLNTYSVTSKRGESKAISPCPDLFQAIMQESGVGSLMICMVVS